MQAAALLAQLAHKARRDADTPLRVRVFKGLRYLRELATARYYLRAVTTLGRRARTFGRPRLINEGALMIGDDIMLRSVVVPVELCTSHRGTLTIGDNVSINYGASIFAERAVTIGDRVRIGPYVSISDTDFHDAHDRNLRPAGNPVVLEDDVWIGTRALVLKGVRIGRGAIVAAGAVVTRDVAAYSVVAGVPAQCVSHLDRDKFVQQVSA
jgi:acetyltransferase-like isoleucine patch superfamily enzyme